MNSDTQYVIEKKKKERKWVYKYNGIQIFSKTWIQLWL